MNSDSNICVTSEKFECIKFCMYYTFAHIINITGGYSSEIGPRIFHTLAGSSTFVPAGFQLSILFMTVSSTVFTCTFSPVRGVSMFLPEITEGMLVILFSVAGINHFEGRNCSPGRLLGRRHSHRR